MAAYQYERPLVWGDCDPSGVIYFASYFRWMGEGTSFFFKSIGCPMEAMIRDLGGGLPAIATQARYFSPAVMGDNIRHRIETAEVRRRSFTLTHQFRRGETLLAEISGAHAWVTGRAEPGAVRHASPLPPQLIAALNASSVP